MIGAHNLIICISWLPSSPNDKLFRLLPQRERFWVRLDWAFEPRVDLVPPSSADTVDDDLPNQRVIDSSLKVPFHLVIGNRVGVVAWGSSDGFGDNKTIPHGMQICAGEMGTFSVLSLVDGRSLTRDSPIPSDLVAVAAAVPASQMQRHVQVTDEMD